MLNIEKFQTLILKRTGEDIAPCNNFFRVAKNPKGEKIDSITALDVRIILSRVIIILV